MIQVSLSSVISKQGHVAEPLRELLKCSTPSPVPLQDFGSASGPLWINDP